MTPTRDGHETHLEPVALHLFIYLISNPGVL